MATATTLTSELEAVNTILAAAGEAPVASLAVTGLLPLDNAARKLNEVSREVQARGWSFNTEFVTLTRNGSSKYDVPTDFIRFDCVDDYLPEVRPQVRGALLYDAANARDTFPTLPTLQGTAVRLLEWASLPQPARHYIMVRAARQFGGSEVTSGERYRLTQSDEEFALLGMGLFEADDSDSNMLLDSVDTYSIISGRDY